VSTTSPNPRIQFAATHEQVIRQIPFGPRPKAVFLLAPLILLVCVCLAALGASGAADRYRLNGMPARYVISVLLPLFAMLASALAIMFAVSKAVPAFVTLTTLGIHFPKNAIYRAMIFVPYSDRPAMHVETIHFGFVTAADIRLNGPRGKYSISKSMLPSDAEFYELAELLQARLPLT
jgi:hypothetical protein